MRTQEEVRVALQVAIERLEAIQNELDKFEKDGELYAIAYKQNLEKEVDYCRAIIESYLYVLGEIDRMPALLPLPPKFN